MESMYLDKQYLEMNPTYHVEDSPAKVREIARMVGKHGLRPGTVCDVGCGAGEVLRLFQPRLPSATLLHGYEISPHAFALCKERENASLKFFCGDLLSTETAPYDLLLCVDVFEHVEDYMGFLRKLRPKAAYKIFHIPLDMSVRSVLRRTPIVKGRRELGHLHYFSKDTALMTLQDTGYEIVDWFYTRPPVNGGGPLKTKLAKSSKRLPKKMVSTVSVDLEVRLFGNCSLMVLAK